MLATLTMSNLMANYTFPVPNVPTLEIQGSSDRIPVGRVFCVGRNYEEHAREMGFGPEREDPFYFIKHAGAVVPDGSTIPYAAATSNYHYEFELVVVIGKPAFRVSKEQALDCVFGYACGLDMTRRDLQLAGRAKQLPWDIGKDVEQSAPISAVVTKDKLPDPTKGRIEMRQNGAQKQDSNLSMMIWSVPEIVSHLSQFYRFVPGDVILTGTPAGVGAVQPGDVLEGTIENVGSLKITIGAKE
jgi:fumarylpyruvate hydrolase